jgi:molybdate transport system permease protein
VFEAFRQLPSELWESLALTLRLAFIVTVILLAATSPFAWWLARSRARGVFLIEALVGLPIVLPPTVLGFYLLAIFSPETFAGKFWFTLTGGTLAFSFGGLVLGSVIYSLPYTVQPLIATFRGLPREILDASSALGAGEWTTFWRVGVPMSKRGLLAAALLTFAHTVGEFGVVVMLGGSIPGKTRVASIALFDEVQKMDYATAHAFALILLVISFLMLAGMTWLQQNMRRNN